MVHHPAMFNYVAMRGSTENRMIEYIDHLHENFAARPASATATFSPDRPGISAELHPASLTAHRRPDGLVWKTEATAWARRSMPG